jgi:hypothetical protein
MLAGHQKLNFSCNAFQETTAKDRVGGKGQGVREMIKRWDGASVVEPQTIQIESDLLARKSKEHND